MKTTFLALTIILSSFLNSVAQVSRACDLEYYFSTGIPNVTNCEFEIDSTSCVKYVYLNVSSKKIKEILYSGEVYPNSEYTVDIRGALIDSEENLNRKFYKSLAPNKDKIDSAFVLVDFSNSCGDNRAVIKKMRKKGYRLGTLQDGLILIEIYRDSLFNYLFFPKEGRISGNFICLPGTKFRDKEGINHVHIIFAEELSDGKSKFFFIYAAPEWTTHWYYILFKK